jgi:Ca-activated chloride channel homolog
MIYTVGLFDEDDRDRNPGILKKIAHTTGGEAFLPSETSEVVPICKRIAEDIRNQYTIGYVPSNQKLDGTYRTIRVTATGQQHEKYIVRSRAGYFASSSRNTGREHLQETAR